MSKLYCCDICEYKTNRKNNFQRHINSDRVHSVSNVSNHTNMDFSSFRIWTHKITLCNTQLTDIFPIYEMKKTWSKNMIPVLRAIRYKLKPKTSIKTVKRMLKREQLKPP